MNGIHIKQLSSHLKKTLIAKKHLGNSKKVKLNFKHKAISNHDYTPIHNLSYLIFESLLLIS